jgi:hypothetical protein
MNTWERNEEETDKSWMWFCRFLELGPERTLPILVQRYARKSSYLSQLKVWSGKFQWVDRSQSYDAYVNKRKQLEQENTILRTARDHIVLADNVMDILVRRMSVLDQETLSPYEWKGLAEFAVKIKRDALGISEKFEIKTSGSNDLQMSQRMTEDIRELTNKLKELRTRTTESE